MNLRVLLFYKFVPIGDTEKFQREHLAFCKELGILGKVLIGAEGINGSVSGTPEQLEAYKRNLWADERFADIAFKEEDGLFHPFRKMVVRVKKEIIRFDKPVDFSKTGRYLEPSEFLELYNRDDVVILDARNDYEWQVGKFKNALTLPIKNFREFPEAVEELQHLKSKPIAMYCTGGIRCEKASAYMVEQGFTNVMQLHGGIITFCQQKPNTAWEGSCFVFDNRLVSSVGQDGNTMLSCVHCGVECDLYRNCRNVQCNERISLCPGCESEHQGCCSQECFESYKQSWHN